MPTDSFTSSAAAVTTATATLTDPADGFAVFTTHGFRVKATASGVTVSKAPTLGGVQAALAFPLSRNDARELAEALLNVAG